MLVYLHRETRNTCNAPKGSSIGRNNNVNVQFGKAERPVVFVCPNLKYVAIYRLKMQYFEFVLCHLLGWKSLDMAVVSNVKIPLHDFRIIRQLCRLLSKFNTGVLASKK